MTALAAAPQAVDPLDMRGRVCLVTGATGGIGQAVARRFHAAGATTVVHYLRSADTARALAAELDVASDGRLQVEQANLAREEESAALLDRVRERNGGIDVVVHCASMGTFKPLLDTRPAHWDLTLGVHARAFWMIAMQARSSLRPGASLVALSSLGGRAFTPAYGAVGVAKAALEAVVRYAAAELASHDVRVNGIAGGPVTGARLEGSPHHAAMAAAAAQRPGGRFGTPDEIADVALFLASPLARWIRGQVLVVDGGFSL
jgi:NAD(P)-dependent dehydrogenase (short-subunit alcohol dehydrogenase family)